MSILAFDTHKAVKALQAAGAAEAVVATVGETGGDNATTKADLAEIQAELKTLPPWNPSFTAAHGYGCQHCEPDYSNLGVPSASNEDECMLTARVFPLMTIGATHG